MDLHFTSRRGLVVEPEWIVGQFHRVRPEDTGGARALILDSFALLRRAVPFETAKKGDATMRFVKTEDELENGWEAAGRGTLETGSGELVIADEALVIEAMTLWRDREAIIEGLEPVWTIEPGVYEIVAWRERRGRGLAFRVDPAPTEEVDGGPPKAMEPAPRPLEITDELDLHGFAPADVAEVIEEYCHLAVDRGYRQVRLIHGKGIGEMRRLTRQVLEAHPLVSSFHDAPVTSGGHGATMANLRAPEDRPQR